MRSVDKAEITLIEAVKAHLAQLVLACRHDADQASLRVASGSLRFLLVEENLARAWKASGLGGPMTFRTWCIVSIEGKNVIAYCGGGDVLPGIPFSACRGATLGERSLNLSDFCKAPRIQIGTVRISTHLLVQFVANTLGGVHFDPHGKKSKKPKYDLLRRLEAGEHVGFVSEVNGRNLLHHELLSIAQTVVRSPEVTRLREWRAPAERVA